MASRWYSNTDKHVVCKALLKAGFKNFEVNISTKSEEWAGVWIDIKDRFSKSHARHYINTKEALYYIRKGREHQQFKDIQI